MQETPLNPRQKQVLTAIVDHYIVKAEPVSSKVLSQTAVVLASSATIRNTMAELEDKGLVEQPHASAGRRPTDLGYRTYVDELMHPEPLGNDDRGLLDQALGEGGSDEAILAKAAKTLADMTQLLGLVMPPPGDQATFRKISLVPVEEGRVAVVLTSSETEVRSFVMDPGLETSIFRLEAVAKRLNQQMAGKPVSMLKEYFEAPRDRPVSKDEEQALELLNRSILKLSRKETGEEIMVYGAKNLLNRQDFSKIDDIGSVLDLLDSKITLAHFLRQQGDETGVHVTVGEEHQDGMLFRALSLVTSAFPFRGGRGMLGVLGPKRMPYARLVPVVDHAARTLGNRFENAYGKGT